jgi:transcriptional regulator with XRE-family HTH domain
MSENWRSVRRRVGRRVKQLRLLRGLSQEQLAEQVGNTGKHISEVELAKVNVGIDVLTAIAATFGVDVAELFRSSPADAGGAPTYVITRQELAPMEEALRVVQRLKSTRARRRR